MDGWIDWYIDVDTYAAGLGWAGVGRQQLGNGQFSTLASWH